MANNAFSFTGYALASTYDAKNGGYQIASLFSGPVYYNLPVVGTSVKGIPAQVLKTGITANAIVEILPNGLVTPGFTTKILTDSTVAALATART